MLIIMVSPFYNTYIGQSVTLHPINTHNCYFSLKIMTRKIRIPVHGDVETLHPQCLGKLEGHSNQEFYSSLLTIPLISKTQNRNSLQSFP